MKEMDKGKISDELSNANKKIASQTEENGKKAVELAAVNNELVLQNEENRKLLAELTLTNSQLLQAESDVRKLNAELERKVVKRSAQYAFISQINQAIVQVKDAETLFRKACLIAIDFGKFKTAWIGSFDPAQEKMTLLGYSGITSEEIKQLTDTSFNANSVQDTVLRTGKYFLCNDIEHSLNPGNWKLYAAKHAIHSCIVLPIKKSGSIFGTFNLYSTELNFFGEEDIKLAVEVAGDISFALDLFDKAEKHKEAEELIIKNEKRFKILIENCTDMITLSSKEGKMMYGSPAVTKLLGYITEEILSTSAFDFIHPDDVADFTENRIQLLESSDQSCHSDVRLKHKSGKWIWCEATHTNMLHESGIEAIVSNFRDISDKKAKDNQHESDSNNLNALINNTNDLMWSVDRDFNLITSNLPFDEAVKATFGRAIAKGENVLSAAYTSEMLVHFRQSYERAFAGESFIDVEHFQLPVELWTQTSYYPIRRNYKIIGAACHSRDITEIKNTEWQLSKSEAFNRGVLNSLSSHIAVVDVSGNIVSVNEPWKTFAKENGDTTLQRTSVGTNYFSVCYKAIEAGDKVAYEALLGMKATMQDKNRDFYLEYPCHAPHRKRWFGMRVIRFVSDAPMIVVSHMDISKRKIAEENLLLSEARLNEAQALTHICNWEVDLITNINTWSRELYNIFGISCDEVKPSREAFLSMIHPNDFEFVKASMDNSFQTFEAGSFSVRIKKRAGDIRYIYSEWKFEFDKSGKPFRLYGILQDVTERKIAEEEREKSISDTIQRNRDLEQFTFIISHNLRAPTANIIGLTEILQDETLTPHEQKLVLKGLATSVSGLDNVIKDISTILQVKREVNDKKEVVFFSRLVNDILISSANVIDKYKVRFKLDFSEVDQISSLKPYLYSIFYNLISNSIKYSKPDVQPLIDIKSRLESGKIILTFKDNGLGIDMKTKGDKIFGLYKRFHSHVKGKGMGLFMVKTQVEAIGGQITVNSNVNEGTEFTIVFEN